MPFQPVLIHQAIKAETAHQDLRDTSVRGRLSSDC
jgi:hypothetical protein